MHNAHPSALREYRGVFKGRIKTLNTMRTENHKHKVLEYMRQHGSITPMEALREFGCYRLGARIYDLRRSGVRIKTELVESMTRPGLIRRLKGEKPKPIQYAKYILQA